MSSHGQARKSAQRRRRALVEYGARQSARTEGTPPRQGGQRVLWIVFALAGIVLFTMVRSPAI